MIIPGKYHVGIRHIPFVVESQVHPKYVAGIMGMYQAHNCFALDICPGLHYVLLADVFVLIDNDNFFFCLVGSAQIPSCPGSFPCDNHTCVNMLKVCNGIPDCPRGDDELVCGELP